MHLFYIPNNTNETKTNGPKNKSSLLRRLKLPIIILLFITIMLPGTIFHVVAISSDDTQYNVGIGMDEIEDRLMSERQIVAVERGDTLWKIASEYAPEQTDLRKYIDQIRRLNNLESSMLFVGQRLELP